MRLRICCCYCTNQDPKLTPGDGSNGSNLPRVIGEQPKRKQSIPLDKINEISEVPTEESGVQGKEGNEVDSLETAIQRKEGNEVDSLETAVQAKETDEVDSQEAVPDKKSSVPEAAALPPDVQEIKSATQIVPKNTSALKDDFSSTTTSRQVESLDEQKTDAVTRGSTEQSQSGISFTVIAPGHLKSVYKGTEYIILNGKIEKINGPCDESDKEFILAQYESAMVRMKQAMLRIEQGLLKMHTNAAKFTDPLGQLVASHNPPNPPNPPPQLSPQNRPTRQEFEEFLKLLKNDSRKPEGKRAVDTSDSVDELGGYISEPPLKKTTFAPKEVVYEDPKTYEKLDTFEIPDAKPVDEYIISRDVNLSSGFYFHTAKPKRVRRKELDRKERLKIISEDGYSLFERECVKVHNKYRSMHGVPPLVNNTFLCKVAKEWAEHLALNDAFYHRPNNDYGENLFSGDRMFTCARRAVKAWYDEIDLYDYKNPKFEKATGHFTQLVWKDTREIGTGVARIGNKVWVCCNYHPPGNVLNKFNEEYIPRPVVIPWKS